MDMRGKTIEEAYNLAADVSAYGHSGICRHLPRMVSLVKTASANSGSCRVVELGIGGGDQSTVAWLYALKNLGENGELHCYDVNAPATLPELKRLAAAQKTKFTFTQGSTLAAAPKPCDILFVDTLHTREQVNKELAIFARAAPKYIAFHDTQSFQRLGQYSYKPAENTGVLDAVEDFVAANSGYGLLEHYLDDNGFLILADVNLLPGRRIVAVNAKAAVVIGTFAAVPYVHLSLAALRKHEPDIKIAVHDDYSPKENELRKICAHYGAEFYSAAPRKIPTVGDLSATAFSVNWAQQQHCDIGVKISRRFIIARAFVAELRYLFENTGRPTVTGADASFGFGYRSEAVAMWAPAWVATGAAHEMAEIARQNVKYAGLPEAWYHNRAKFVDNAWRTVLRNKYDALYPQARACAGFTPWPLLGLARTAATPGVLWHDSHTSADYANLARSYDLPYTAKDFKDPNMGFGAHP